MWECVCGGRLLLFVSLHLFVCLSVCVSPSVCLRQSVCLFVCISVCLCRGEAAGGGGGSGGACVLLIRKPVSKSLDTRQHMLIHKQNKQTSTDFIRFYIQHAR